MQLYKKIAVLFFILCLNIIFTESAQAVNMNTPRGKYMRNVCKPLYMIDNSQLLLSVDKQSVDSETEYRNHLKTRMLYSKYCQMNQKFKMRYVSYILYLSFIEYHKNYNFPCDGDDLYYYIDHNSFIMNIAKRTDAAVNQYMKLIQMHEEYLKAGEIKYQIPPLWKIVVQQTINEIKYQNLVRDVRMLKEGSRKTRQIHDKRKNVKM